MASPNGASHEVATPRSVLVYSLSWLPGQVDGIAVRMMAQVKQLAERGVKVTLIAPSYELPGKEKSDQPLHTSIPGVELVLLDTMPMPVYKKNCCAAISLKNFQTIVSTIRRVKPDIVHHTQCASIVMFATACIVCDVPMIISMHTDVTQIANRDGGFAARFPWLSTRAASLLKGLSIFVVNMGYLTASFLGGVFFTVSTQALQILEDASVPKSSICPEAWGPMVDRETFRIDLPQEQISETRKRLTFGLENAYLIVYVGRITAEKDVQFLVDALDRAPKNVVLALIGSGSMVPELSKLHGKEKRLYCTGEFVGREQVALAMRAADLHASASVMETVGFTAMEALSCGTPMLAANAQGFKIHLTHGVNARLFTPGDEKSFDDELAAIMATKREGDWTAEALRKSMELASLPVCTDRALRAYEFASRRPKHGIFTWIAAYSLFFLNIGLLKLPFFR